MTDEEFLKQCKEHLAYFSEGHKPIVPVFHNDDGTLNRDKMLALPCFSGFLPAEKGENSK